MSGLFSPSYYTAFRCSAGACQHTCCSGWDIEVDADTAAFYRAFPGPFGEWLRSHLVYDAAENTTAIRTDEQGRCPFLHKDGLCSIIHLLSDSALCQICRDHPRFRNYFRDRVELGLGCCCEEIARLVLTQDTPLTLVPCDTTDDGVRDDTFTPEEESAFFKRRSALLAVAADTRYSLAERCQQLLTMAGSSRPPLTANTYYRLYQGLERLDPAWDDVLARLLKSACSPSSTYDEPLSHLLEYFLYRHLADASRDGQEAACIAFAVHSVWLIAMLTADTDFDDLCEVVRAYCAEIEYSDSNLQALFDLY